MEIRKLLAAVIVVLFVPVFAALAYGQAASTDTAPSNAAPADMGSSQSQQAPSVVTPAQPGGYPPEKDIRRHEPGTGASSDSALTQPPGGPDLRPREGDQPPMRFSPGTKQPGTPGTEPLTLPAERPEAVPPRSSVPAPSTDKGAADPPDMGSSQAPDQSSVISPSGRESVVVTPGPDSAVIVPGPSVVVPAPAAVAPVQTAPAQPGGYPPEKDIRPDLRTPAPGGFVEPPQGPDVSPGVGLTPTPGYPAGPQGKEMKTPGTEPITLPSTGVVVPGAALPGPAAPGGMPAGTVQQPMAPAPQAPAAVQPAPSVTQPALPSDQQNPDIIIITPVPQSSTAPGTMK